MRRALLFIGVLVVASLGATALAEGKTCEPDLGLVPGYQFVNGGDFSPGDDFLVGEGFFGQGSGDRLGQGSGDRLGQGSGDRLLCLDDREIDDPIFEPIDGDF